MTELSFFKWTELFRHLSPGKYYPLVQSGGSFFTAGTRLDSGAICNVLDNIPQTDFVFHQPSREMNLVRFGPGGRRIFPRFVIRGFLQTCFLEADRRGGRDLDSHW
jgi:hypothetical protein